MYRKLLSLVVLSGFTACGGGGGGGGNPGPTTATVARDAAITASGGGALVLHPSLHPSYDYALETPVRIQETGGGQADWNFARFSILRAGREVERGEVGSDVIRNSGWGRIAANSNSVYNVVFRFNSDDFDTITVTLGFADIATGRQFETVIPESSFPTVNLSFIPMKRPVSPDKL